MEGDIEDLVLHHDGEEEKGGETGLHSALTTSHQAYLSSLCKLALTSLYLLFFRSTVNDHKCIPCAVSGLLLGITALSEMTFDVFLGATTMNHPGSSARLWLGAKPALVTSKAC